MLTIAAGVLLGLLAFVLVLGVIGGAGRRKPTLEEIEEYRAWLRDRE